MLKVRQNDETFDSDSFLLFSRLKVPNPNFFRKDDAFELKEPVLKDRVLVNELVVDLVLPSLISVAASELALVRKRRDLCSRHTCKKIVIIVD